MKYIVLFTSLLLGATATPISQRQTTQGKVSGFCAGTNLDGDGATISYDFEIPGVVSTHCSYSDETSGSRLPAVTQSLCDDPAVRWQFRQDPSRPGSEGRYSDPSSSIHRLRGSRRPASHEWAASDFPQERIADEDETVYLGASNFVLDAA
ncbi:hypothetical protein NUW58_g4965 [Xylaria curta]|uniref:Uncharacterized protein n=1 Tax=Xylaria curta TaxID=42375 RepID=A0ACC1P3X5_9PEZI|nr:hypothetical protein NUW58_g4965 [Xylaria curta]